MLPNFFLIGAPKCGTTALYHALNQHPDIFLGQVKEPGYFAFNGCRPELQPGPGGSQLRRTGIWQARDYLMLYAEGAAYRVRGDATTLYLRSPEAAQAIQIATPSAKIVAILRQPAERAYSGYQYAVNNRIECASTFVEALAEEPVRIEQGWFSGLFHRQNGFYHQQISHYYQQFPPEQIKVYLYEDWSRSPASLLQDLFQFLEVDPSFQPALRRSNVTRVPRNRRFHRLAHDPKVTSRRILASALGRIDRQFNQTTPPPLDREMRCTLTEEYRVDITQLQDLIRRDLSHWLS